MSKMHLVDMGVNKIAMVKAIEGGLDIVKKLESMGIRPGKSIKKISSHFWRGPVTIMVGKTKIAIGHGMAQKIIIEE